MHLCVQALFCFLSAMHLLLLFYCSFLGHQKKILYKDGGWDLENFDHGETSVHPAKNAQSIVKMGIKKHIFQHSHKTYIVRKLSGESILHFIPSMCFLGYNFMHLLPRNRTKIWCTSPIITDVESKKRATTLVAKILTAYDTILLVS